MRIILHYNITLFFLGICLGIAINMLKLPSLEFCPESGLKENIFDSVHDFEILNSPKKLKQPVDISANVKPLQTKKTEKKFVRPRYYANELGIKKHLFVAVVSDESSINTFGVALNKTIASYSDKIVFFLDGIQSTKMDRDLPVVGFKSPKPSLKMLRVLSYVIENFLEDYNYFYFVTDHTYVDGENLNALLENATVSLHLHVGVKLKEEKFCSLESGILLSRNILRQVKDNLAWCIQNAESSSFDRSFGKCVVSASNGNCSSQIKAVNYESMTYGTYTSLKSKSIPGNAVTISGLSESRAFYELRAITLKTLLNSTVKSIRNIQARIDAVPGEKSQWPTGSFPSCKPDTRHDVIPWDYIYDTTSLNPDSGPDVNSAEHRDIMDAINCSVRYVIANDEQLSYKKLHYGYRKFDRTRGMDYKFELGFTGADGNDVTRRVDVFRGLALPEFIPMPFVTESSHVFLILYADERNSLDWIEFIKRLEKNVEINQLSLSFMLHYVQKDPKIDPYKDLKNAMTSFSAKYYSRQSRASWKPIVSVENPTPFEIADMALRRLEKSSLVFMTQAKAFVDTNIINKVRLNTVEGWQIYSLIPFTAYHPNFSDQEKISISGSRGWYDSHNYNSLSFYVSDYMSARKSSLKNKDSPKTPEDIITLLRDYTSLHILRAPDSSFVLPYENIECSKEDTSCRKRKAMSIGTNSQLSKIVLDHKKQQEKENYVHN